MPNGKKISSVKRRLKGRCDAGSSLNIKEYFSPPASECFLLSRIAFDRKRWMPVFRTNLEGFEHHFLSAASFGIDIDDNGGSDFVVPSKVIIANFNFIDFLSRQYNLCCSQPFRGRFLLFPDKTLCHSHFLPLASLTSSLAKHPSTKRMPVLLPSSLRA